jgi:mRNA-degrading endonuclease toxin of MazEF toxin-antitoxin module
VPRAPFQRGDIYVGDVLPDEARGHEQHNDPFRPRPWLIVSDVRELQPARSGMVIACPISRTDQGPHKVLITPGDVQPDGGTGLSDAGAVLVSQVRAMSTERLTTKRGRLNTAKMAEVDEMLMAVLGLS